MMTVTFSAEESPLLNSVQRASAVIKRFNSAVSRLHGHEMFELRFSLILRFHHRCSICDEEAQALHLTFVFVGVNFRLTDAHLVDENVSLASVFLCIHAPSVSLR